jgi:hypothetical protein
MNRFTDRQKYVIEKAAHDALSGEVTKFHKYSEQLAYDLVRDWFVDKLTGEADFLLKVFKG